MNQDEFITSNMRLTYHVAHKFKSTGIEIEELAQIGVVGLVKAAHTFKPEKQIKFASYATRCITNEILMQLRRNKKHKYLVSLDAPLESAADVDREIYLSDVLGTDPDAVSRTVEMQEDTALLHNLIKKLDPRSQKILKWRYGLNGREALTQREVSRRLGITQSYVCRIEKKIIARLEIMMRRAERFERGVDKDVV